MQDGPEPPDEDTLPYLAAKAVRRLLSRSEHKQAPAKLLQTLRWQLAKVLAEAPVTPGGGVAAIDFRARLACVIDKEISKQEALLGSTTARPGEVLAGEERRRWPRRWVHLSAQLRLGSSSFDCTLVDLSEGGAQVETSHPLPFMEAGVLKVEDGSTYRTRCRWVNGTRAGFEFTAGPFASSDP